MDAATARVLAAIEDSVAAALDHDLFAPNIAHDSLVQYVTWTVDSLFAAPEFVCCTTSVDGHAREYQAADRAALIDRLVQAADTAPEVMVTLKPTHVIPHTVITNNLHETLKGRTFAELLSAGDKLDQNL